VTHALAQAALHEKIEPELASDGRRRDATADPIPGASKGRLS
jgi:hypothetical protein